MASNSEKLLLKQITDLTRQIEKEKRGFSGNQFQSKKFVKPWAKKSSATFYNAYVNGRQHWHKPASSSLPVGQPGTSSIHPKLPPKPSTSKQQNSFQNQTSITENVAQKPFQNQTPITEKAALKPKQVFVNPNFVPGKMGMNVHVNPNFRSLSPVSHPVRASEPATGTSSGSLTAAPTVIPIVRSVSTASSGPALGPTVSASASLPNSVHVAPSVSSVVPTGSAPSGPAGPFLGPGASVSAGSAGAVPGGCAVQTVPVVAGRIRRRSRSLSSRYRLLTARKLVRRLSKDASGTPPAPAAARRTAAVLTRHKLVRVVGVPRAQLPAKLVSTRHKLVRAAPTPRSQQQQLLLIRRQTASRAGATSWSSGRAASGPARPGPSSRYKLVRTAVAAAAGAAAASVTVHSQHRTWRRRNSTSTPAARLMSTGSLRLGSTRFVNIGGLLYKSTARKLQRAIPKPAQKNKGVKTGGSPGWISVRGARFRVEAGGRSLRRLDRGPPAPPRLDIGGLTFRPTGDGTLTADSRHQASRSLISRAKSRSLAVLRDSLRLSRQPCRFFCRLGRCRRHERAQCPHVHDAALRPVCTRHLQEGGCRRPGCGYNHEPRPEKVPHCLHFLTAECRRENCPYQHVNVDADAPLCTRFLAGFCPRGQQCTDKHLYICPEFSEKGECPRGTACPLAHHARRRRRRSVRVAPPQAPPRGKGRYYLGGKAGPAADSVPSGAESDGEEEVRGEGRRRAAMAEMPSFIAIADSSDDED